MRYARLVSVIFAALCVVVSALALSIPDRFTEYEKIHGVLGEEVQVNEGLVTVRDVEVGEFLADNNGDVQVRSHAVFVKLTIDVACPGESCSPASKVQLHAGDRTYTEWRGYGGCGTDAGYRCSGSVVFEVHPDDLADLVIETYRSEIISGYQAHAWIDLQLDDRAEQLRADAEDKIIATTAQVEEAMG